MWKEMDEVKAENQRLLKELNAAKSPHKHCDELIASLW
jgi:hypothetical protein